ncbi:Hypothetical predicted protein [Olea europaea subsp. europaea]|uniref:Uncharacterized protein n=1 Tax=Olea europaea subsp. europaea TaxID=158383 RepID=A0A8S0VHE2_OLEEU|nr:Hypothetical predicted protein [Olea europaea subsp. europaea]
MPPPPVPTTASTISLNRQHHLYQPPHPPSPQSTAAATTTICTYTTIATANSKVPKPTIATTTNKSTQKTPTHHKIKRMVKYNLATRRPTRGKCRGTRFALGFDWEK